MGEDHIAEVVCLYCGKVTGKKVVSVPESFDPNVKLITHGICGDCLLKLYSQLPETKTEPGGEGDNC